MCCVILLPHVAYRLSADWMDKDPRTGILGLVWDRSRVLRYIRMRLIITFPHLDIARKLLPCYSGIPCESSLLSAFQIIVFSHLLADHPFVALITVKPSCHLVSLGLLDVVTYYVV
jgi:hypothetical protein